MPKKLRVPSYRRLKSRNLAFVDISGKRTYLGRYDSPESKHRYEQIVRNWIAQQEKPDPRDTVTIAEVILAYWQHVQVYFGPESNRKSETYNLKPILRLLNEHHGDDKARDFDTLKLKALREKLIAKGNTRPTVNKQIDRVRRMFRWAAGERLVHTSIYADLSMVERLKQNRSEAPEGRAIPPVSQEVINATLPHLPTVVGDMVRVQLLTGMRPGELVRICPGDIDRSADVWLYSLAKHKTAHRGRDRTIAIGPRAQAILTPYLLRPAGDPCFTPTGKAVGEAYDPGTYRQAVHRACRRAGVELWGPNRLRKARATEIRKIFGIDAAKVTLGHSDVRVTMQHYAEVDRRLAVEVALRSG